MKADRFCGTAARHAIPRGQEKHSNSQFLTSAASHESRASDKKDRKDYIITKLSVILMAEALAVILAQAQPPRKMIASFYPDICGHSKRKVAPKDMAWLLAGDDAEAGQTAGLCRARQGYRAPRSQHRPAQTLHSVGKSGIRSRSEHHQLSNI